MEYYNSIAGLIGTLGFPIVACAALFWQNYQQDKRHKEESDNFAKALNNNTLAIQKLQQLLDKQLQNEYNNYMEGSDKNVYSSNVRV